MKGLLGSLAAWPLLLAGCVTGKYTHVSVNEPLLPEHMAALSPGTDTLGTCLDRLGAPNRVFEYRVGPDRTAGMALLWVWRDESGWGIEVSGAVKDVSGSVSYDQLNKELPGCVLWFSPELVLEGWRMGRIGELLRGRIRPSPVDQG